MQKIEDDSPEKGQKILNEIDFKLRSEVYKNFYCPLLYKIDFFIKNFSKDFIEEMALNMNEILYSPG